MTVSAWIFLTLAIVGAAFGLWQLASRRRTFRQLNALLDRAIAGGFSEDRFDETELSALEGKLARFLRGSAHAQKMIAGEQAAVKALIADISHQTRTPIANLLLYASLLLESDLPPRQQEQARALMTQGEKLSFLIQNLVKASRLETGIVVPIPSQHSVKALLEEVIEQEEPAAQKKGVALKAISLEGAAAFDLRWTSEALGNVVDNAVKYTPAGGTVTVSAQMLGSFCRVDVTDTGPGIPEGEQGEIFNRFYRGTGTRTAEGLGLGLYLTRKILTLQGGYIKVSSIPGSGSTPRQQEQARALMTQGEKLSFLIQNLVKASRLETGIVVPIPSQHSVKALLEEVIEQEEPAAQKKGVALKAISLEGAAAFDLRWTSEALGNVVDNAVKYTPAGGTVTVSAQMLGSFCRVDVTDTGPGIPEGEQGEIFNRFYRGTGTRTAEGLGLGLYLTRKILTLQGGYIKVSSIPGSGSTFSLYLPRE